MYPDIYYEPTHASDGLPIPPDFRRASGSSLIVRIVAAIAAPMILVGLIAGLPVGLSFALHAML